MKLKTPTRVHQTACLKPTHQPNCEAIAPSILIRGTITAFVSRKAKANYVLAKNNTKDISRFPTPGCYFKCPSVGIHF